MSWLCAHQSYQAYYLGGMDSAVERLINKLKTLGRHRQPL